MGFRLVVDEGRRVLNAPASGPFNMGVDEALLATALETGLPSLRFYTWDGPWLSVGYAQPLEEGQGERLAKAGVGLVRRVTGGRAVLHGADLTYAIAAPEGLLPSGVRESYGVVADALLLALTDLAVDVRRSDPGSRAPAAGVFDCFERPAADEICLGGLKLSGSAQRRVGDGFLQHGSIRMRPDPPEVVRAVAPDGTGLGGTSLEEGGYAVAGEDLVEACLRAFESRLGVALSPAPLDPEELRRARARRAEPAAGSHLRDAPEARIPLKS